MADKDLKIQITTAADTSGADAAAASLKNVEAAAKGAQTEGWEKTDISDLNERLENLKGRAKAVQDESAAMKDLGDKTEITAAKHRSLTEITGSISAITMAAKFAGAAFDEIAKGIATIDSKKLAAVDPAAAKELENVNFWIGAMEHPMQSAVQGLHKLFTGETVSENYANLKAALDATAKGVEEAFASMQIRGAKTMDQINEMVGGLVQANKLLDAMDKTDAAKRNRQDAADIDSGKDPADVKAARAVWDRDQKAEAIRRQMGANTAGISEEWDTVQTQRRNLANAENKTGANTGKIEEERKKLDDKEKDILKRRQEALDKNDLLLQELATNEQIALVEAEAAQREKSKREQAETDKRNAGAVQDTRRITNSIKKGELEDGRKYLDATAEKYAGVLGEKAEASNDPNFHRVAGDIGKALSDGTNEKEISKLQRAFSQETQNLGAAAVKAISAMLADLQKQAKAIATIENQIKNSR